MGVLRKSWHGWVEGYHRVSARVRALPRIDRIVVYICLAAIITALIVIFYYAFGSLGAGSSAKREGAVMRDTSRTKVEIRQDGESQAEVADDSLRTGVTATDNLTVTSNRPTKVEVGDKSVSVPANTTFQAQTSNQGGNTDIQIRSESSSNGGVESSFNLGVNYSSTTEVSTESEGD